MVDELNEGASYQEGTDASQLRKEGLKVRKGIHTTHTHHKKTQQQHTFFFKNTQKSSVKKGSFSS